METLGTLARVPKVDDARDRPRAEHGQGGGGR